MRQHCTAELKIYLLSLPITFFKITPGDNTVENATSSTSSSGATLWTAHSRNVTIQGELRTKEEIAFSLLPYFLLELNEIQSCCV